MARLLDISAIACAAVLLVLFIRNAVRRNRLPLPPGPPRLPILGNIHQLPMEEQQRTFAAWGEKYGDVIFAKMFRTPTVILNSFAAAEDLLDKRSSKYSDRPRLVLQGEIMGWQPTLPFQHYPASRQHRKWIAEGFSSRNAQQTYRHVQEREACRLLADMVTAPGTFKRHIERWAGALIVDVTYGHRVDSLDDKYVTIAREAVAETVKAGSPGSIIVDFFPTLKQLPMWVPGAAFKRRGLHARVFVQKLLDTPFSMVQARLEEGTARPSFTGSLLEAAYGKVGADGVLDTAQVAQIKGASASVYSAGFETTVTVLTSFMLAMVRNPEVFRKAQKEVDAVVGKDRLPNLDDRESLPYVDSVLKEVYRWNVAVPLGLPHRVMVDDEYRGYHIPAGSIVMANVWWIMRDPANYTEPEKFMPERHMGPTPVLDPRDVVFGFGRRQCPGMQFADANLFLAASCLLAVLDIGKAVDENGKEITPSMESVPGFISQPKDFPCSIRPRTEKLGKAVVEMSANS